MTVNMMYGIPEIICFNWLILHVCVVVESIVTILQGMIVVFIWG